MLQTVILGMALIAGLVLAGRWFVAVDTRSLLKTLKWLLLGTIFSLVLYFILSGRLAWAFVAVPALLPWFFRLRAIARAAKTFTRMRQSYGPGAAGSTEGSSDIETQYVRMWLDHETGMMSGEVISGPNSGRQLNDMNESEVVCLWQECKRADKESGRVLEAYMDRTFPNWRDPSRKPWLLSATAVS